MDEIEVDIELRKEEKNNLIKLVIIAVIIYSITIAFHGLFLHFFDSNFDLIISDQVVFYNRGVGILKGDLPYRDFPTRAAPLSPYLWAPIVLISIILTGNYSLDYVTDTTYMTSTSMMFSSYVFRIFFSCCLIISALILYKLLESRNTKHSFWISLGYAVNPYFLYLVSFWGSDECIVPLLILLPIYLLERKKFLFASICIVIGAGLKYFPILLIPLILIYRKDIVKGFLNVFLILVGVTAVFLPFYFVDPVGFLAQFNHPLDRDNNQGIATLFDKFLINNETVNLSLIFLILAIVFVGSASLLLILEKKWKFEKTYIIIIPFLMFFPKIQFSYFVMMYPFVFITLFKKNMRLVSLFTLLFSMVGGVATNYILTFEGGYFFWYTISWITVVLLYLSMLLLFLMVIFENRMLSLFQKSETI